MTTVDFDAILDQAKPVEKTVPLCLQGNLVAEFEDLERQLTEAQRQPADSLASGADARRIAEQMETLREQMQSATVVFRLRALPRRDFRALVDAHPPRLDDRGETVGDDSLGVNTTTVFEPLIRACLVEPEVSDGQWDRLNDLLSDMQFNDLALAAWSVNRGAVNVPFSFAASLLLRNSEPE